MKEGIACFGLSVAFFIGGFVAFNKANHVKMWESIDRGVGPVEYISYLLFVLGIVFAMGAIKNFFDKSETREREEEVVIVGKTIAKVVQRVPESPLPVQAEEKKESEKTREIGEADDMDCLRKI